MKKTGLILYIIFLCNVNFAQVQNLKKYIEEGRTFDQIYSKASKFLRKSESNETFEKTNTKRSKNFKYLPEEEFMRLERWAWYWRDRTNVDGTLGDPGLQWELYKEQTAFNPYQRSGLIWKHEGPTSNTGGYWSMGRTTHIDFHPNDGKTFYVAAANGGVWKTTNSGKSYASIGENLPQQPVGIVIVDQKNPNTIFITIGEKDGWWQYGLGVYKTTNGGQTWSPTGLSYKLSDNKVIYGLVMNPLNSNILIAATNNGIFKTTDAGVSWNKVRTEDFSDVKYKIGDPNIVYAARNDYWGSCEVFKSTDGGDNWNQISNFNKQKSSFRLVTTPADPEYLCINASEDGRTAFYLSKNGGNNFEFISSPPENSVLFISPTETGIVYCGSTKIHKSFDGGYSWNTITNWYNDGVLPEVHADHHFVSFTNRTKNEIYFCHDGGLNKYDENTESWEELSNGLPITQFYKMAISTTTPPTLIGGSQDNGGFIKRSNGTWGNTNGGDAMWQLLDPTNSKIGYTEYWGGRAVYRTTDNFNNLTDLHANIPGEPQGQWVTPFNLNPQNPKTFIIGYNDVFISPDRGNTFFPISNNLTGAEDKDFRNVDMSPVDTNIIMASYSNLLFYTYNYGKTWNKSTLATSFEISSIEFHPQDSNRLWVTRSGLGTFKVQESIDKGKTWKNLTSNFVNTPALIIRFDQASNSLFVGTDIGLFYSDADKINWQYYGNGLPNTSVTDIELHQATRKMYISTYGRGFYSIDLPSCAPAVMTVQSKLNTKSFAYADSIKICLGDEVILKSHIDNLQGSYHWRGPRNFDTIITNTNLLNLGAFKSISKTGNYSLEFVSEKLCTRIDSIYIKVNALPSTQIISDFPELDCSHNQVTLSNSSLNSSNQYQWSMNGKSISDSSNITISNAATYVLKITNSSTTCSATDTISISQILPPEISYTSQNVECYGEKTGSIDLKIKGGTQPYSLVYSNPILLNGFNNLPAGEYIIIITDSKNCNWRDTIRIKENTQLKAQFPVKDAAVSDGSITSIIQGGVPPYKYEWSKNGITISNEPDLKDLESGFYKLIITDSLNCFKSFDSIEVKQVTSVSENKLTDFIIYPNPTKDYLTISSISHSHLNVDIEICNISGSNYFFKKKIKNAEFEKINLSFLNSGTYILKIKSGHKVFEHKIEIVH